MKESLVKEFPYLPPAVPPRRPSVLPEVARLWDAVVPKLHRRRVLTAVDGPALELLCSSMLRYQQFRTVLKAGGAAAVAKDAEQWRILTRQLAADFFMLPVERVTLAPLDGNGDDAELVRWFEQERAA